MSASREFRKTLMECGATDDQVEALIEYVCGYAGAGQEGRYSMYTTFSRKLRNTQVYPKNGKFSFPAEVKAFLRTITGGEVVDADPPLDAISISLPDFVKYVLKNF
jgi:hypothetical protein